MLVDLMSLNIIMLTSRTGRFLEYTKVNKSKEKMERRNLKLNKHLDSSHGSDNETGHKFQSAMHVHEKQNKCLQKQVHHWHYS